jgi:hemerythrin
MIKDNTEQFSHYLIGLPNVDEEHFILSTLLCKFKVAVINCDLTTANRYKEEFLHLLSIHLASEEQMMVNKKFPYIDNHIMAHKMLQTKFERIPLSKRAQYSNLAVEDEFLFHVEWLDSQLTPFCA